MLVALIADSYVVFTVCQVLFDVLYIIQSFNSHTSRWDTITIPIQQMRKMEPQRDEVICAKVTWLVNGRAEIHIQAVWLQNMLVTLCYKIKFNCESQFMI